MVGERTYDEQAETPNRLRLVLADDDAIVRFVVVMQLQHDFDFVGVAPDAPSAIALVAQHRPDVVILDVDMPGGGARRASREIGVASPGTAIVILSGDELPTDVVVELMNGGAIACLRKGIASQALIVKLRACSEAHSLLTERPSTVSA